MQNKTNQAGMAVAGWSHQQLWFKKGMAIASLNVNGLRGHFDEIQMLLKNLDIHIFALNETKLDKSYPNELTEITGYQQERLERNCNGGGVSIYVKGTIKYKVRSDVPIDGLELICIEIEPPKSKPFLVLSWYRPPSETIDSFNKLERVLSCLDKESKEIILLGDTNCDLSEKSTDSSISSAGQHITNLYELFSFKELIEEPTRVTVNTSTIIDHIATTCPRNILHSGV